MKVNSEILVATEAFVFAEYNAKMNGKQLYHDYNHTVGVVEAALLISGGCNLEKEETEDVMLAAWFHDVGFVGTGDGHEAASAAIAEHFLSERGHPAERIERIKSCIMATKMPQQPENLLEEVLCDADLHYVGTKRYQEISNLLRVEWEFTLGRVYSDHEWIASQIDFLTTHKFHTPFAQLEYSARKNKNVTTLSKELKAERAKLAVDTEKADEKKAKQDRQKAKERRPDRGIETMFRITSRNHMELSGMADNKANIMISINALIISIIVSTMVPKLDKNTFLVIPTFVLLTTCLITIIYATLSTRPKISGGTFTKDDIAKRKVNLLFFGNFYQMKFDEFEDGMNEMMKDKEFLYGNMVKDIYSLGQVLGKKYKLIRTSYNVFMYGLILSVLSFAISFYVWNLNQNELAEAAANASLF